MAAVIASPSKSWLARGIPPQRLVIPHTAKFHLDRLCDEGLLQAEFRRLSGRTGPGAGRPAKLYRRAGRQFAVSLPERRYDLAAHILATAVQEAARGAQLADALRAAAYEEGRRLGAETSVTGPELARLARPTPPRASSPGSPATRSSWPTARSTRSPGSTPR